MNAARFDNIPAVSHFLQPVRITGADADQNASLFSPHTTCEKIWLILIPDRPEDQGL
jgi:hypothetical protein